MRRWLWPYAILVVVLLSLGLTALAFVMLGLGPDRAAAQLSVADAVLVEPVMQFLISMLDMIAPVDLPVWFKQLYAVLVIVALCGFALSMIVGLLLLPVFYALYRGAGSD